MQEQWKDKHSFCFYHEGWSLLTIIQITLDLDVKRSIIVMLTQVQRKLFGLNLTLLLIISLSQVIQLLSDKMWKTYYYFIGIGLLGANIWDGYKPSWPLIWLTYLAIWLSTGGYYTTYLIYHTLGRDLR